LIFVQVLVAAITGALSGLVGRSFLGIISGAIFTPILTLITILVSSLFFYYTFQIFAGVTLPFRRIATVVFFATLPFFIFKILSDLVPPIVLIGLAFTSVILIVGFVENFRLPKKLVVRIILGVYVMIFLVWAWGRWDSLRLERNWRPDTTLEAPEVHLGE